MTAESPLTSSVPASLATAGGEHFGVIVTPECDIRRVIFQAGDVAQLIGATSEVARACAAFEQEGESFAAYYSPRAILDGAEPNPLASMARNTADTDNPDFLADPTRALAGPVLFAATEGGNLGEATVAAIENAVRAISNYRSDHGEEYELWHNAVINRARENHGEG